MSTRIEDTRAYFVEKYGEPYEKIIDGKKYKSINSTLSSYNELIENFGLICDRFEVEFKDCYIDVLSDFAVIEGYSNMDNVNKKLKSILACKNNVKTKVGFLKFLEESAVFYNSEKYDPRGIIIIFQDCLKVENLNQKYNFKNLI